MTVQDFGYTFPRKIGVAKAWDTSQPDITLKITLRQLGWIQPVVDDLSE